jgi:hypothetical protein
VFYRVEFEVESLLKGSHPLPGNDAKVRELLDQSLRGNHMAATQKGRVSTIDNRSCKRINPAGWARARGMARLADVG